MCVVPWLLAAAGTLPGAHAATPPEGHAVFEAQCADCHTVKPGKRKRGPTLAGIVGSASAQVPNYNYSEAMRKAGVTWTPERLARYLAAPKTDLPGTKMRLLVPPSEAEIKAVIAWLQQQH